MSALLVLSLLAAEPSLKVERGLVPHQVLAREDPGAATAEIEGSSGAAGAVEARVLRGREEVLGWRKIAAAEAPGGWKGRVEAIPAGGPYRVELRVRGAAADTLGQAAVEPVVAGDLLLLAGQSNMEGVGEPLPLIYEAQVDRDRPHSVILKLNGKPPAGASLWYGHGFDPYLNLADAEDMAAPVCGPGAIPE